MPRRRAAVANASAPISCLLPAGSPTRTGRSTSSRPAASNAAARRRRTAWLAACSAATETAPAAQASPRARRTGMSRSSTTRRTSQRRTPRRGLPRRAARRAQRRHRRTPLQGRGRTVRSGRRWGATGWRDRDAVGLDLAGGLARGPAAIHELAHRPHAVDGRVVVQAIAGIGPIRSDDAVAALPGAKQFDGHPCADGRLFDGVHGLSKIARRKGLTSDPDAE